MSGDPSVMMRIRVIGDVLMPRHVPFPSFTEADPDGQMLSAALHELRRDRDAVRSVVDSIITGALVDAEQIRNGLDAVRATDPGGFELLRVLIVGTYLSCRPVWEVLGYPGRVDNPVADDEAERWLGLAGSGSVDALLDPVRRRGPIFRPTPPA